MTDPTPEPTDTLPTAVQAVAAVIRDVSAVDKSDVNEQQRFKYRSIDRFMDALNPVMGKHQVVVVPKVVDQKVVERERPASERSKGGITRTVVLTMRFRFYGPRGDYITATTVGEANDTADKATNKAMTAAFKYAVMQTFMVPTADIADSDRDHVETPAGLSEAAKALAQKYADEAAAKAADWAGLRNLYGTVKAAGLLQVEVDGVNPADGTVTVTHLGPYITNLGTAAAKARDEAEAAAKVQDEAATQPDVQDGDPEVPPPAQCEHKRPDDGEQCKLNEHHPGNHSYTAAQQ